MTIFAGIIQQQPLPASAGLSAEHLKQHIGKIK